MSDKLHKAIKLHCIETEDSIQEYIIRLIKQDLQFKSEEDDLSDYKAK